MKNDPLILVTNDDGYNAPGITALTRIAKEFGEVVVVSPMTGQSGMSHAVTLNQPIRLKKVEMNGVPTWACSGTPADCVKIAFNKILDRVPDLVLSGINHGSNASVSLFYSGTVAATIEACMNGVVSAAISIDNHSHDVELGGVTKNIRPLVKNLLEEGLPEGTCLNVNFPDLPVQSIKGLKVCRQTLGVWKEEFEHRTDPHGRDYYWLTGEFNNQEPDETGTDEWAMSQGYGAIVPIKVDVTDRETIDRIKGWGIEHRT